MGRRRWIVIGCVLAVAGFAAFWFLSPSPLLSDVEVQGDPQDASAERLAWIGLATGIVGLLTALAGLAKEVIALRKA